MLLVERPGYRIDSRTIKRGSRPSIVILSFVDSSNLYIHAIIFISYYLDLIMVWSCCLSCSSWQGQVHRKRFSYASPIAILVLEILSVHPCGWSHSSNYLQNLLYLFSIFPRFSLVVFFPTKLVSLHLDFICKRYGVSSLRERGLNFPHFLF